MMAWYSRARSSLRSSIIRSREIFNSSAVPEAFPINKILKHENANLAEVWNRGKYCFFKNAAKSALDWQPRASLIGAVVDMRGTNKLRLRLECPITEDLTGQLGRR